MAIEAITKIKGIITRQWRSIAFARTPATSIATRPINYRGYLCAERKLDRCRQWKKQQATNFFS